MINNLKNLILLNLYLNFKVKAKFTTSRMTETRIVGNI